MKINSIVAVSGCSSGNFTLVGDGVTIEHRLKPDQLNRLASLAHEFFLENQAELVEQVQAPATTNQLTHHIPEAEYVEAAADDIPF